MKYQLRPLLNKVRCLLMPILIFLYLNIVNVIICFYFRVLKPLTF